MNFFKSKRSQSDIEAFRQSLAGCGFPMRINYPYGHYKFGHVAGEIPRYLSNLFYEHGIDYFNLVSTPEDHDPIYLNYEECMHLAQLFTNFRESAISRFRNKAIFELHDAYWHSLPDRRKEVFLKYFGQEELDRLSTGELPNYYGLYELFCLEVGQDPLALDLVLRILREEYGKSMMDLDYFLLSGTETAAKGRVVNGIPCLVANSGKIYNLVLRSDPEKILILNCVYANAGRGYEGYWSYKCGSCAAVKTITGEELHVASGTIHQDWL